MSKYFREDIRLGSFLDAHGRTFVTPMTLANAGFHYGNDEMITCQWCKVRFGLARVDEARNSIASLHGPECKFSSAQSGNIPLSHPGMEREELVKEDLNTFHEKQRQAHVDVQTREVRLRQSRPEQQDNGTAARTDDGGVFCTPLPETVVSLNITSRPIFQGVHPEENARRVAVDLEFWEISLRCLESSCVQISSEGSRGSVQLRSP